MKTNTNRINKLREVLQKLLHQDLIDDSNFSDIIIAGTRKSKINFLKNHQEILKLIKKDVHLQDIITKTGCTHKTIQIVEALDLHLQLNDNVDVSTTNYFKQNKDRKRLSKLMDMDKMTASEKIIEETKSYSDFCEENSTIISQHLQDKTIKEIAKLNQISLYKAFKIITIYNYGHIQFEENPYLQKHKKAYKSLMSGDSNKVAMIKSGDNKHTVSIITQIIEFLEILKIEYNLKTENMNIASMDDLKNIHDNWLVINHDSLVNISAEKYTTLFKKYVSNFNFYNSDDNIDKFLSLIFEDKKRKSKKVVEATKRKNRKIKAKQAKIEQAEKSKQSNEAEEREEIELTKIKNERLKKERLKREEERKIQAEKLAAEKAEQAKIKRKELKAEATEILNDFLECGINPFDKKWLDPMPNEYKNLDYKGTSIEEFYKDDMKQLKNLRYILPEMEAHSSKNVKVFDKDHTNQLQHIQILNKL